MGDNPRQSAAMQEIADWLEKLGMSEYAGCFAENKINLSALRYLTDQDLKDIGIPLGHRRIMLAEISALAGSAVATREPAARTDAAERRQVTVMFSDLVGSGRGRMRNRQNSKKTVVRTLPVVFVNRSAQGLAKAIAQGNSTHGRGSDHIDSGSHRTACYGDQPGHDKGSKSADQHDGDAVDQRHPARHASAWQFYRGDRVAI
jgi:class 3 adenylate cyclase